MRTKQLPLLVLLAVSISFMAFLVMNSRPEKIACTEKCPIQKQTPTPDSGGGSGEIMSGSFNHLIVSTRK